jgi:hypothetical protein
MQSELENPITSIIKAAARQYDMSDDKRALIIGYIKTSKEDLMATKILFAKRLFASSTYHLQQAVEKASKAFGLFTGILSIQDVRGVSHDSIRVHNLMASKFEKYLMEVSSRYLRTISNIESLSQLTTKEKRMEIARLSEVEIERMIAKFDSQTSVFGEFSEFKTGEILAQLREIILPNGNSLVSSQIDEYMNKLLRNLPMIEKFSKSISFLFIASAITFPHETFTRYPDKEIKPWEYNQSMGIVSTTPSIMSRLEQVLLAFEAITQIPRELDDVDAIDA